MYVDIKKKTLEKFFLEYLQTMPFDNFVKNDDNSRFYTQKGYLQLDLPPDSG